jgi:hypothetical protein
MTMAASASTSDFTASPPLTIAVEACYSWGTNSGQNVWSFERGRHFRQLYIQWLSKMYYNTDFRKSQKCFDKNVVKNLKLNHMSVYLTVLGLNWLLECPIRPKFFSSTRTLKKIPKVFLTLIRWSVALRGPRRQVPPAQDEVTACRGFQMSVDKPSIEILILGDACW